MPNPPRQAQPVPVPLVATFSIAGHDPRTGDLGIAVQSKFLAVGAVVPWARAGVGAIATQSWANTSYGPAGLNQLAAGQDPEQVIQALVSADEGRARRQVGIVDAQGRAASYTGAECFAWAGGRTAPHCAAQGNILVSGATVDALAETFLEQQASGQGELADHLVAALAAGQAAGGDSRGMQSAALLVVRAQGGYSGFNDRYIDLRVDDHAYPIAELRRILDLHQLYFQEPDPASLLPLSGATLTEVRSLLHAAGFLADMPAAASYDAVTAAAFGAFAGRENLEERLVPEARIDPVVLRYLRNYVQAHHKPAPAHSEPTHLHLVRPARPADE
ncbi:MAG TPA: DUF1028 domain-containing protein [Chloroflexia bacterium]|nr:DUF1028 domain-containing protein [Chloroflexia bacterium]